MRFMETPEAEFSLVTLLWDCFGREALRKAYVWLIMVSFHSSLLSFKHALYCIYLGDHENSVYSHVLSIYLYLLFWISHVSSLLLIQDNPVISFIPVFGVIIYVQNLPHKVVQLVLPFHQCVTMDRFRGVWYSNDQPVEYCLLSFE